MPAAERYGLMCAIDRWVVRAVFATLARTGNPDGHAIRDQPVGRVDR